MLEAATLTVTAASAGTLMLSEFDDAALLNVVAAALGCVAAGAVRAICALLGACDCARARRFCGDFFCGDAHIALSSMQTSTRGEATDLGDGCGSMVDCSVRAFLSLRNRELCS